MRKPLLLAVALIAMPALAFDQAQVMQPAALANVRSVHIAPVTVELPAATRRAGARGDAPRPVAPRDAEAKAADLTKRVDLLKVTFQMRDDATSEAINAAYKRTLVADRAAALGWRRQLLDLASWAVLTNTLAWHLHQLPAKVSNTA